MEQGANWTNKKSSVVETLLLEVWTGQITSVHLGTGGHRHAV